MRNRNLSQISIKAESGLSFTSEVLVSQPPLSVYLKLSRGSVVATRQAHNLEDAGSIPAPAIYGLDELFDNLIRGTAALSSPRALASGRIRQENDMW